ncbi:MAG: hypothetical protein ABIO02_01815, partial [Patescibacteria group bacterium]
EILLEDLSKVSGREIALFSSKEMSEQLYAMFQQESFFGQDEETAVIAPGKGAQTVRECLYLPPTYGDKISRKRLKPFPYTLIDVDCSRNGNRVSITLPSQASLSNFSRIVVLDDVVRNGTVAEAVKVAVIEKLREENGEQSEQNMRSDPFRDLDFRIPRLSLYTWLSLDPSRRATSGSSTSSVYGYDEVRSVVTYKGGQGIPPVNSLSTVLGKGPQSAEVRSTLSKKYFGEKAMTDFFELYWYMFENFRQFESEDTIERRERYG